jgi:very-short-patch-repair endonuclease
MVEQFKRRMARELRSRATDAELILWRQLRRLETRGTHFRRQVPIGNYVADFACLAARLIVEVDGSQHAESAARRRDADRTAWLEAAGYRVIRFWNSDVAQNIEGVLDVIHAALYGSPDAAHRTLRHTRSKRRSTPPRRALRADPPPPGEGDRKS